MTEATAKMIRGWIRQHNGDTEAVARYMRDSLGVGGIKACRKLIQQARAR